MTKFNNLFNENLKDPRFDGTLEKQKELVIEALQQFESFLFIGNNSTKGHPCGEWILSSSIRSSQELAEAILKLMLVSPRYSIPIMDAAGKYLRLMEEDNETGKTKSDNPT